MLGGAVLRGPVTRGWVVVLCVSALVVLCLIALFRRQNDCETRFTRYRQENELRFQMLQLRSESAEQVNELLEQRVHLLEQEREPTDASIFNAQIGDFPPWYGAPTHNSNSAPSPFPAGTGSAPRLPAIRCGTSAR